MSETQALLERIKKLQRLAASSHSEHEAQTALLRVQELMAKHNIAIGEVQDPFAEEEEEVVNVSLAQGERRMSSWKGRLAVVIAENFRCIVYKCGVNLHFVGLVTDVEACKGAFQAASEACDNLGRRYVAKHGGGKVAGSNYRSGFVLGLGDAFKAQAERHNWALVLAVPAVVKRSPLIPKLSSGGRSSYKADFAAREAGRQAGQSYGGRRALEA